MSICPQYNLLQKEACFHYVDMLFPMETPWGKNSRLLLPPAGYKRYIPLPLQLSTELSHPPLAEM